MLLATGCHHKPTQKPQSCHFSNFFEIMTLKDCVRNYSKQEYCKMDYLPYLQNLELHSPTKAST